MFHRERKNSLSVKSKPLKNLIRHVMAHPFLAEDKRQILLQKMKDLSGLEPSRYDSLCTVLIINLVNYCQNLPETTNSYYSQPGGLVDHALNRTEAALSLFQEFLIRDAQSALSEEQMLWQYALYSAALLQGIGKLFVDYQINLFDTNGQLLKQWNPLLESLINTGSYYDYEFQKESDIEFRRRLNLLMAKALMPASGFAWIASNAQVLAVWLALLNEDLRSAGTLGSILIRADALAIQRYLLKPMLKGGLNHPGGPYGRSGTFSGGVPESLIEKEQVIGAEFIRWLSKGLGEGRIMINKAPLFMVPGGMLMCQEIFQLFARGHPEYKNWQAVQKGFLALGFHRQGTNGSFISLEQVHNQSMQSGVVFSDYGIALPDSVEVVNFTTGQIEFVTAVELVNRGQQQAETGPTLQKLSEAGNWGSFEQDPSPFIPGARQNA